MNKKFLTILVIIATIISVIFILYPNEHKSSREESVQVENTNASKEKSIDKLNYEDTASVNNNLQKEDKEKTEDNEPLVKIEENDYENLYEDDYNSNEDIKSYDEEDEALTASMIFKVDKDTIENKLSVSNKAKLLYYASKLSNFDYARIKNILDNGEEVDGAKDIVKILKSRLKTSDYEEVKKILSPYIDIDKIEEYISV